MDTRARGDVRLVTGQQDAHQYSVHPTHYLPSSSQLNQGMKQVVILLNRRKFMILMTAFILVLITTVVIFKLTPRYTSEASLLINGATNNVVVDQRPVLTPLTADPAGIKSELDVIRSRQLADKVIQKLALNANPIFTDGLPLGANDGTNLVTRTIGLLPAFMQQPLLEAAGGLNLLPKADKLSVSEQLQRDNAILVNKLLDGLNVSTNPASNTIKMSYTSEDPKLSSDILNAFSDLYLVDQLEAKFDATKRANTWLSQRLVELKTQAEQADAAVASYRTAHGLTAKDVAGTTVATQQLAELNTALITAEAERATKEGKLQQFQSALKKNDAAASSAPEVIASPLISQLRATETEVARRRADLTERLGDRHPAVLQVNSELRQVQANIGAEMNKIVSSLAQDAAAARIRVDSLRTALTEATKKSAQNSDDAGKLNELTREAQATRTLYDSFLGRFKETSTEGDLQQADARIIARAEPAVQPSFPNKKMFVAMGALASLALGVILAFIVERLDNGFRSGEDVERYLNAPTLGLVPAVGENNNKLPSHVIDKPWSPFTESIRSIRMQLRYTNMDKTPKTVLVTSSLPEEGKSLFALSLAREAALSGQKTLLVDCDLRKPTVLKTIGGDKMATLADHFSGEKTIEEVLHEDKETGMFYIVGRANSVPNPPEMFDSQHMTAFLQKAAQNFDLVVIDSPPVMAASDAAVLSKKVDATLFVLRWGETPRPVVVQAIKSLANMGTHISGVVLSRVNVKRHARYGTGDHGYYYGNYQQYGEKEAKARA